MDRYQPCCWIASKTPMSRMWLASFFCDGGGQALSPRFSYETLDTNHEGARRLGNYYKDVIASINKQRRTFSPGQ